MAVNWEVLSDQQVTALRSALWSGAQDLAVIPKLVKSLLEGDLWKVRLVAQTQKRVEFQRFSEFVSTPAPEGLGTSVETLKKFCQSAGDLEAVDQIDKAAAGKQRVKLDNIQDKAPDGTSLPRALRDLRKKRPDLHARVLAKELSANAAMIEAGLRRRQHTIPHDTTQAAAAIRRHFTKAEVAEIARLLHWGKESEL